MKEKTRTEYSLLNMLTNFSGYFLNTVAGYLCRIIFVRCLAAEYLGISGLFSNILSMLSLAELGIGSAIGYALYKPVAERDEDKITALVAYYKKAYQIIGIIVIMVGLSMIPFIKVIIRDIPDIPENIYVIYLMFLFNATVTYFYSYKGTLLYASQRNYVGQKIYYMTVVAQYILQVVVLLLTKNYMLYLVIQSAAVLTNNLLLSRKVDKDYPFIVNKPKTALTRDEKKSLFVNTKALTINKLCSTLVNNTDNIAITYFNGLITTGVASNYTLLISTLGTLIGQVFSSMTASIGNMNAAENDQKKYHFFEAYHLANFWVYGWAAVGIALVSTDLVRLCFGDNYVLEQSIPIVLAINFYFVGMNNAVYAYKSTLGLFRYGQYLLFFTAIINLGLDILLGIKFGVLGIFLATLFARLLTNVWFEPWMLYKHGFHKNPMIYFVEYLLYAVIWCAILLICYHLCALCHFAVAVNVILKCIICSVIPNVVCWLCFHKTHKYQQMALRIGNIFATLRLRLFG